MKSWRPLDYALVGVIAVLIVVTMLQNAQIREIEQSSDLYVVEWQVDTLAGEIERLKNRVFELEPR